MKQFLIVGNINAITYKEVFPYIKTSEIKYRPQCIHKFLNGAAAATWYTTLIPPYIPPLELTKSYTPEAYPRYDNYDAIEVSKTINIPMDYDGVMGVPLTFFDKYNPNQFEIIGCLNDYKECDYANGLLCGERIEILKGGVKPRLYAGAVISKKGLYNRILIRHRK